MAEIHEDMSKEELCRESIRRIRQADAILQTLDQAGTSVAAVAADYRLCAHLRQTGIAIAIIAGLVE